MKNSPFDNQSILHVDGAAVAHTGVVVGQSDDGTQVYVKSDRPNAPKDSAWDFAVSADLIPVMLTNAKLTATPRIKYTQTEAQYSDHASDPDHRCALCVHFRPSGHCQIVKGTISADGWCKYFEAKSE